MILLLVAAIAVLLIDYFAHLKQLRRHNLNPLLAALLILFYVAFK